MIPAPINPQIFEALQANAGADFVVTLVDAFAEESPQLLAELRQAAANGDRERYETAAHTMKSNAVTFGATQLAELAYRMERQGPGLDAGATDALAAELAVVLPALRSLARQR